ncbi:MAG TPA: two-component regulator propeller domain-containing protein, partial [Verrucomicrobiae bacterium]
MNNLFVVLKLHYILAVLLVVFSSHAAGGSENSVTATPHDYLIHEWQTEDGLPQNWVSSIAQTPDGYLWIGTRYGGLARFDGVRFVAFNQQNTPNELKDVQVEFLNVDETGTLWVIMGNESITAVRNGEFKLWRWPRTQPRLRVESVLNVRSNTILFAPEYIVPSRLNISAGTNGWEVLEPPNEIMPRPRTFVLARNEVTWFITEKQQLGRLVNGR